MFTGIVSDIGIIESVENRGDTRIRIATSYDTTTVDLGASIACSGVCLTVVDKGGDAGAGWFDVQDASAISSASTTPGAVSVRRRDLTSTHCRAAVAVPTRSAVRTTAGRG